MAVRVVFMGTAELACASLKALAGAEGFEVVEVVTQPDRPKGRSLRLQVSPVKAVALERGLPVSQPGKASDPEFLDHLRSLFPELIVVAAYGQILRLALLEIPRFGCVNVHASLLPKYRGAGPIQWAIWDGEEKTGVTIMLMDAGLDTGPILAKRETCIGERETAVELQGRLAVMGAELLVPTLAEFVAGRLEPYPQPKEGVSYARKIRKEDGWIDWSQSASRIGRQVRALQPWPGAFTEAPLETGRQRIKLLDVAVEKEGNGNGPPGGILGVERDGFMVRCGQGILKVLAAQREGGRGMPAADLARGCRLEAGVELGRKEAGPAASGEE